LTVADVRLPGTLTPLFPGLPRRVEVEAGTVLAAIDSLEAQWPGLRDRIVEEGPALRRHLHVYVDGERAGLDTAIAERSRLDVIAAISGG
jgi:molybdopterin synthase sulfur carrier subunit